MQSSSHSLPIESRGAEVRSLKTWPWVAWLESCGASGMVAFLCDAIISPFATAIVDPVSVSCTFLQFFSVFSSEKCPVAPVSARAFIVNCGYSTVE